MRIVYDAGGQVECAGIWACADRRGLGGVELLPWHIQQLGKWFENRTSSGGTSWLIFSKVGKVPAAVSVLTGRLPVAVL
jgi:dihydrofolate reductase